ncbi:MAG: ATP-binding protein [Muribaculaceae bacterium]|nr:ATP-binding protein [Muribaculaceae bacterium]
MLLRFAAENILSFKDAVEFNTFPSSKSHSHDWHKVKCGHVTALRMSAVYGANGAGKSNLLRCIYLLKQMMLEEKLGDVYFADDLFFKFDAESRMKPSELAIEFFVNESIYYYHIVFTRTQIEQEELYLCEKKDDIPLFVRKGNEISLSPSEISEEDNKTFSDVLTRIVRPDMLLLAFFGKYYPQEFPPIAEAYRWLIDLQVVLPDMKMGYISHYMDSDAEFKDYINSVFPKFQTGIYRLDVKKEVVDIEDAKGDPGLSRAIEAARENPGEPVMFQKNMYSYLSNIVCENDTIFLKSIVTVHRTRDGKDIEMQVMDESDGTRRLIEYLPLLYWILKESRIFIVDEIERSIHPIMIKTIMSRISENTSAKGQIIFTTHESCLLDQSIFRPDEIWFAQKDVEQATQLYPLSDYNVHKTANIENGYLHGRYGAIPFLSNLSDLNW